MQVFGLLLVGPLAGLTSPGTFPMRLHPSALERTLSQIENKSLNQFGPISESFERIVLKLKLVKDVPTPATRLTKLPHIFTALATTSGSRTGSGFTWPGLNFRAFELLPHVINHCRPLLHRGTDRHNKIVKRIKDAASRRWNILLENLYVWGTGAKPDLVLEKDGHILILDVTCPFDDGIEKFNNFRHQKIEKYKPFVDIFCRKFKSAVVEAVIVGSLGSWDPKNDRVLLRLCTKKYLRLMKKLIVSETIRSSRDIFFEHIWGERQVDTRS